MRVATPLFYQLSAESYHLWYNHLPPHVQVLGPPNLITPTIFDAAKGDFMNWHTDMRPAFESQRVSQDEYAPVLSLNLFMDMDFWVRPYPDGNPQRAIRLVDGMGMLWPRAADFANKHGAWFPRGVREGKRVTIVMRWSNLGARRYTREWPHRVLLSEEERALIAAKRAEDAARNERKRVVERSVHTMAVRAPRVA